MSGVRARGFFVTGTDTGVGKTEVACALIGALERSGWSAVGMKPVAAGARRSRGALRSADAACLDRASRVRAPISYRNPYVFAPPIAPHIAAAEAGVEIDLGVIADACRELVKRADLVVVEGAGGFCVPLGSGADMGDLARRLRLPVIMVVGMRLGCISHALLTAEAIDRRGLTVAGWIANRVDAGMKRYRDNVLTLQDRIDAPMLADVPHIDRASVRQRAMGEQLDVSALARWLPRRTAA